MRLRSVARFCKRLFARFRKNSATNDAVTISGEHDWHKPHFLMRSLSFRDQVARVAGDGGWEEFEKPTPHFFSLAVKAAGDGLVIDVGANTGFYTLLALSLSGKVRLAAYEPLTSVRTILEENIKLNKAGRRVEVYPYAVSDTDGQSTLHIPDDRHGLIETSASLVAGFKSDVMQTQAVSIRRLDSMHLGKSRVAIIKVDAEGHDLAVLTGAETLITKDRPIIFIEVLLGADEAGLTDLLTRCRYKDVVLSPTGASPPSKMVSHRPDAWNHMLLPEEHSW